MATRNRMQERLEADAKLRKEHGEDIGQSQPPKMINTRASRGLLQAPIDAERQMAALVKEKYGNGTALPCLNLDPSEIRVGRFFNRLPQSFDETLNVEFAELLDDVRRTGGNLVSGLVRPYVDESNPKIKYELVFGERRLKACIKAGAPFKAEIAEISDAEFVQLHSTENRFRPQLSIVESALQFKSWLDSRTDVTGKKGAVDVLAAEVGYSRTHFYRLTAIAEIDEAILFSIPGAEKLSAREIEPLVKAWGNKLLRGAIADRCKDLVTKGLAGGKAINYLISAGAEKKATKQLTFKAPSNMANRDEFIRDAKLLFEKYGIEVSIK